jgi:metal-responsive CopG/Arc/MetJ family transcriptional regulator
VKTAISVPDATFERVEQRARELGVSRSEFYARAAEHWLQTLDDRHTTDKIDQVLIEDDEDQESPFLARAAARLADTHAPW